MAEMEECRPLECWRLAHERRINCTLLELLLKMGRETKKPWYSYNDVEGYRKYMALMITIEDAEKGETFKQAVKDGKFSLLNHFLLNTELGKGIFPGMTLLNLQTICLHKQHNR